MEEIKDILLLVVTSFSGLAGIIYCPYIFLITFGILCFVLYRLKSNASKEYISPK